MGMRADLSDRKMCGGGGDRWILLLRITLCMPTGAYMATLRMCIDYVTTLHADYVATLCTEYIGRNVQE